MDLTPGQQRLAFVVVVVVLAGLGIYLISARGSGGTPAAGPSATPATGSAPASPASSAYVPPTAVPTAATPVSTAGGAEIYQWLPFSPADLNAAVTTTTTFAKDYATWTYTESAAAYGAKFNGLATAQQITYQESGFSAPGFAQQRTSEKQVSTGSGRIDSIRSFAANPSTITFLVTITSKLTSTQPTTTKSDQFAVTVSPTAGAWQVHDFELASLGNS